MKIWFLTKMILLCDFALQYKDGADDQNDINMVVGWRNYFIKEINKHYPDGAK
jgi:hypothetical protein